MKAPEVIFGAFLWFSCFKKVTTRFVVIQR
jgi:hypothetical protein